ncbi:hypothetical protein TNCV_2161021 [Trichonephila clavipes]|nr:hypothetical protein TNCV_2161021 [Trichonephila clavipes]
MARVRIREKSWVFVNALCLRDILIRRRAANPCVRLVKRKRGGRLLTTPRVFALKFGVELSKMEQWWN